MTGPSWFTAFSPVFPSPGCARADTARQASTAHPTRADMRSLMVHPLERGSESIESPVSLAPGRRTLSRWRHPSSKATEVLVGKVLVLYHSASGNTAAMARLVAE